MNANEIIMKKIIIEEYIMKKMKNYMHSVAMFVLMSLVLISGGGGALMEMTMKMSKAHL